MKSIHISCKKVITAMWVLLLIGALAVALLMIVPTVLEYKDYLTAQDKAIAITLETTDYFDDYEYKNDRQSLVNKMYSLYNPHPLSYTVKGVTYNNSEEVKSAQKLDEKFGQLMTAAGFPCLLGSTYLEYATFQHYANVHITGEMLYVIAFSLLFLTMVLISVLHVREQKKSIVVLDSAIVWSEAPKNEVKILIQDIQSVAIAPMHGLRIKGQSFNKKASLVKNNTELYKILTGKIEALRTSATTNSDVGDLEKYKTLLDKGIITQEEFDAKKKQLLGL